MKDYLKDVLASSYQNKKTAQNTLEKHKVKLDKELSGKEAKVYCALVPDTVLVHCSSTNSCTW